MLLEVLLLFAAVVYLWYRSTAIPKGMPPGSLGWPIIGALLPRNTHITEHLANLKEKYGKIFCTKWGSFPIVVFADHELAKKAYSHPDFQGRRTMHSLSVMDNNVHNTGVISSSGKVWVDNRRFLLRHLRDLGMGSSRHATLIQDEVEMLVKYFEQQDLSQPLNMGWGINVAVLNVIWQMVASRRYEADNKTFLEATKRSHEMLMILQGPLILLLDVLPWLVHLTPSYVYNKMMRIERLKENSKMFRDITHEIIDEHVKNLDPEHPLDIIDFYLLEIEEQRNDPRSTFKPDHSDLVTLISDLFIGGSDTTSITIRWLLLFMALYPEVQKKAQEVLDEEVPKDRLPSMDDRPRLAYIDALVLDVLRFSSLGPIGLLHMATEDVVFEDYRIPKGTLLMTTLEMFHRDPSLWEKPHILYPEHFLDSDGNLQSKHEGFHPFSLGRRQCLGESVARMELFLFAAALLQRFSVSAPEGVQLDTDVADKSHYKINQPKPYKLMFTRRI